MLRPGEVTLLLWSSSGPYDRRDDPADILPDMLDSDGTRT